MNVYVPAFELDNVAVDNPTELMVSLSLTDTVNVTISVWSLVLSSMLLFVLLEFNPLLVGGWLSTLPILSKSSVTLFPAYQ